MKLWENIKRFFGEEPPPPPAPVRPQFPCGIRTCFEAQDIVRQDDRETVVECPVHLCVTTWETKKREERYQQVINPRDGWHQYGTKGTPKK